MQNTVSKPTAFSGIGLHTGKPVRMIIQPASADYGIWFKRTDVHNDDNLIAARWNNVEPSRLCTLIKNQAGISVSTIEHVMAALAGCGIHNALIEIDGPEVPILDGSSVWFVRGILKSGLRPLNAPARVLEIRKTIEVHEGEAWARLQPGPGFQMQFHINFTDAAIGRQDRVLNMANGAFVRELSTSRTFCRLEDVNAMQASGLALGGTYENAVVVDGDKVLSPGGLRYSDEPVRHKMLDALGDLALAGAPFIGQFTGYRAGHALTNRLLHAVFADPDATKVTLCDPDMANHLPGVGVEYSDLPLTA